MLSAHVRFALLFCTAAFRVVEIGKYLMFASCLLLMGVRFPLGTRPPSLGISGILALL